MLLVQFSVSLFYVEFLSGKMEEARRLIGQSKADEKRAAAELVLRRAEAKLRRTADLSVRSSLDRRNPPLADRRQQSALVGDVRCLADTCATSSTVEVQGDERRLVG